MIPSRAMATQMPQILCIAGPTASGKSSRAVEEALARNGEVISVDSRQVYRTLNIGTEKITSEEMRGVPHHLIDIRNPEEAYSAGDFVADAVRLIEEISARGRLPVLAGGTHFYFDALLNGLPAAVPTNESLREELEKLSTEELYARIRGADSRRASELDPANRRRLVRALEIIAALGTVPPRNSKKLSEVKLTTVRSPTSVQPIASTTSYKERKTVEPISSQGITFQQHAEPVLAPAVATNTATAGAPLQGASATPPVAAAALAPAARSASSSGLLSPWTLGLAGVVTLAAGAFVLL